MIWIPRSRYQVLKRLLWRADDSGVVIKKDPQMYFLTVPAEGFEGIRWWAWQTLTFPNTEKIFHTSQSPFFEVSVVNEGDDVWLYKQLRYTIQSSINKQLIHLDLLSLHRITLCHFYDSSQTPRQSIIETIYHLLDGSLFHWVCTAVHQKRENELP